MLLAPVYVLLLCGFSALAARSRSLGRGLRLENPRQTENDGFQNTVGFRQVTFVFF